MRVTSANSFKTCYIAEVKEDMGLLTGRVQRRGATRKIKAPEEYKKYISQAIKELQANGKKATYKEIQQKAFEIYQEDRKNSLIQKYMNTIKPSKELSNDKIKMLIEDEELIYED